MPDLVQPLLGACEGVLCPPPAPLGVTPHWGSRLLTPGTAAAPEQWIFLHEAALAAFLLLFRAAQPCLLAVSCLVRLKASQQLVRRASQAWGCMFARDFLRRRCPGGPVLLGR